MREFWFVLVLRVFFFCFSPFLGPLRGRRESGTRGLSFERNIVRWRSCIASSCSGSLASIASTSVSVDDECGGLLCSATIAGGIGPSSAELVRSLVDVEAVDDDVVAVTPPLPMMMLLGVVAAVDDAYGDMLRRRCRWNCCCRVVDCWLLRSEDDALIQCLNSWVRCAIFNFDYNFIDLTVLYK